MVDIEQQADRTWVEERPTECPNGHPWTRGAFTVSSTGGQGTRYWTCKTCGAEIHATELTTQPDAPPSHDRRGREPN